MKIIIGLGNPGKEYENTRHNVGFKVIDKLSKDFQIDLCTKKWKGISGIGNIKNEKVVLLKPQTYMNLSGQSVLEVMNFYKVNKEDIIVIHDDLDIEFGNIKLKKKGSSGGQNGVKNIIQLLNTEQFNRVRVGIGRDRNIPVANYVLSNFHKEDEILLEIVLKKSVDAIVYAIMNTFDKAMNIYNKK